MKASKLHDKRLNIIAELYRNIVDLDLNMKDLTAMIRSYSGDKEKFEKDEIERLIKQENPIMYL